MQRVACVCCNGELRNEDELRCLAGCCDLLIAADGGATHLSNMGLKANVLLGDMDSLLSDPWPGDESVTRITFPRAKDRSDTELAIEWAIENNYDLVVLLACAGRRIDHTLGQCSLLLRFPGKVVLCDDGFCVRGMKSGQRVDFAGESGAIVSLIPFTEGTRVTTSGLEFQLKDQALRYATHGLSNTVAGEQCSLSVSSGTLLLSVEGYGLLPPGLSPNTD